ncbi:uncharacterized protein F5891DRAFT_1179794 [Suillus fuscotomentosus]|uniref:DUF6570 domain-containing protein n=1 Tax=Suillus fuscotomentosus TaxID=1912939 RepID=A0AAD4ELH2_9AGAM|nr:uncharacterized protein F5891DRAFT_1179794 [Suillus fuscotomentosus]KAG1908282.1 hypothetical protein F5891DRAFT_1179794 [Suillus fuscotomentosus]
MSLSLTRASLIVRNLLSSNPLGPTYISLIKDYLSLSHTIILPHFPFLFYTVHDALSGASSYDLMLISCARASHVTHFYTYKANPGGYRQSEESSQRYNQGNVAIRPQDSPQLHSLLPPMYDEIRDTVCVVFAGHNQVPT